MGITIQEDSAPPEDAIVVEGVRLIYVVEFSCGGSSAWTRLRKPLLPVEKPRLTTPCDFVRQLQGRPFHSWPRGLDMQLEKKAVPLVPALRFLWGLF